MPLPPPDAVADRTGEEEEVAVIDGDERVVGRVLVVAVEVGEALEAIGLSNVALG